MVTFTATFANAQSFATITGENSSIRDAAVIMHSNMSADSFLIVFGESEYIRVSDSVVNVMYSKHNMKYVKSTENASENLYVLRTPLPVETVEVSTITTVADTTVDFIIIDTIKCTNGDTIIIGSTMVVPEFKKTLSVEEIEPVTIKTMDYSTKTDTLSYVPDSFYQGYIKTYTKLLSHRDGSKRVNAKCKLKWLRHQMSLPKYCRKKFPASKKVAKATYRMKKLTDFPSLLAPISRLNCRFRNG